MRYILGLYLFTISLFGFNYHLKPYSISEGVECFFGLASTVNKINGGNIINTCFVETDDGFVVIDSGPTYSYAQQAYTIMQKMSKMPVKYVINTSTDEVHILGNGFYKERGAILIGPKDYNKRKKISLKKKITSDAFINTRLTSLDKIITKDYTINIGNEDIKIQKIIKDSNRFLTVYIPNKKIFFAGDMIYNNRILSLKNHRSVLKWIKAIRVIEATPWKRIVSSYGIKTKLSALKNTKSYLTLLRDEVINSIKEGMNKRECIKNIKMKSFQDDRLYNLLHKKNIANAYDEFKPIIKKNEKKESKKIIRTKEKKKKIEKKITQKKVSPIYYHSFSAAIRMAKRSKKIVLIKIRSDNCPYCDELDRVLEKNNQIKQLINQNYKMVQLNNSKDYIPLNIRVGATPTLAFVRPDTKKVVMITSGIESIGELISILKEAIRDGHNDGYLK
jgi:glyoxylase-like metal-dependent hydrolase (beta-lactamase superfamily II)